MKQRLAVAVDLGATNVRVALISQRGKIVHKKSEQTKKEGIDGKVVTKQIENLIQGILGGRPVNSISGIGISSIGPLDHKMGGAKNAPNIPFPFIPLTKPLAQRFSLPVFLLKDTHAGVIAEKKYGAGKNIDNIVYVTISTGIGGGAIVNGHLAFGKSGNAAEIGHLTVSTNHRLLCTCKKGYGHWEGLASGRSMPRFFVFWAKTEKKNIDFSFQGAKDIFTYARYGNKIALSFLDEVSRLNARAISDIIVAYDPELITIGGSVALNNKGFILKGIRRYVDRYLALPQIQVTRLGEGISLLGAAAAAFEKQK